MQDGRVNRLSTGNGIDDVGQIGLRSAPERVQLFWVRPTAGSVMRDVLHEALVLRALGISHGSFRSIATGLWANDLAV